MPKQVGVSVEIFTHREDGVGGSVVLAGVLWGIALGHVETEAHITQLVEQIVLIGDAVLLHTGIGVVKVASALKSLAGIIVSATWLVVVGDDAGVVLIVPCHRVVTHCLVEELEINSVARRDDMSLGVLVIENQVHNDTGAHGTIGLNHVHELTL